jgi:ferredoxin
MDVCSPHALNMRIHSLRKAEGGWMFLALRKYGSEEKQPEPMMTFPFLAEPEDCDGCMDCVKECPAVALEIIH